MKKFLNTASLLSLIQSGEGYNVEFKIRVPSKLKELSEEICAFSNAAGGVLLIGVSDDNIIHGAEIDNTKRSAIQNSLNEINPHIPTSLYPVKVEGKTVWVIEVDSGTQKPYVLSGAIYVRQGPNTQKLTTVEQMRDFFQQSDRIYFDEAPCPAFDLAKDMDLSWFEEFRLESGLSKTVSQKQIIQNLRLILPDGNIKNGGALFFGSAPEQFVETAVVRCIAFEGETKTQIIDDKTFGGPLIKQYEQAMQWLKNKLDVRYEIEGSGPRKELWEIPETALKEAIVNALCHRDYYDKGARITVELFKDRVEITNPGGLTSAITEAEFGTKSHSRNPLIFGLFVRIHMVEQVGSGVGRIKDQMKDAGLPEPQFKTDGMFTVVLKRPVKSSGKSSVVAREKIIILIKEEPSLTREELAAALGITIKGIDYHLSKMKKEGILKREGSRKTGTWVLNPSTRS
ncbi:helix-turn-helix domain-containing protein [Algoriphagus sp. AGSA1]|uniref:AlbA family DNA-binding domain-containing protein n=1 Tax=Algoriphagus sp. AGSA1 TaxID=2907213 RepID=UPI001F2C3121|nr:helix-turn-helix domain-containing protein [Algoriphagus sp. AGSA1]MCE7053897.1 helix-turn-helix domain-containing protein [Algoriphagus sp. AGSA1]